MRSWPSPMPLRARLKHPVPVAVAFLLMAPIAVGGLVPSVALAQRPERTATVAPGWFGVDVQTIGTAVQGGSGTLVSADYPRVVAVEPGSPAARAGLAAGDRLISIDGVDLRGEELDLATVLRPGRRVPVRFERDGRRRDVTVVVTERPRSFSPGSTVRVLAVEPGSNAVADMARAEAVASRDRSEAAARAAAQMAWRQAIVEEDTPVHGTRMGPSVLLVAGAELMRPNSALRAAIGVDRGIYILSVGPYTPAERAGLRAGDVLVRAGGRAVEDPGDLVLLVRGQDGRRLRLEVLRERRPITLELAW